MQTALSLFQRHQLELIARVTPHAMAGHMLNTSVLAIALAGSVPTADLAIWCTYSCVIALLVLYRHVRNRGRAPNSFRRAAHRATVYGLLLALPWSTMAVLHLGALGRDQELILIALVVGMAASGAVLLSAVPSAAYTYMSGILLPGAVKCLFLLDQKVYLLLGVLAVSYWWFLAALITKVAREISERKHADVALRESETRLQEALTAGRVVAFSWDPGKGHSHRSENALQVLGLGPQTSADRSGDDFLARVHPQDRPGFAAQIKALCRDKPSYSTSFRFTRPNGQEAWLEETGKAEFDADGGCYLLLKGLTRDITERKQAEEELHKRERKLRVLLETLSERTTQLGLAEKSALVGSFAYDVDTDILQISDGYAAIHGLPSETREIARSRWLASVHPEDRVRVDELRSRAFCMGAPEYTVDFRIVRPGGEVRWIDGRAFVEYRDDSSPQRVVGVNIDVTERQRAQAAVEESEARYRALYHDNPSMYFTVDASGTVLSVNEFGALQLGYRPAELVGQSVLTVIHHEDHEAARRHLASCAETNQTVATTELRKVHRDGNIIWVREVARAVREPGRQRIVLLIVCEDITERKKAELALAERNIQLALAGKAALVGSWAYDTDTEIMQISEGYAAIRGFAEGTVEMPRSECLAGVHLDDIGRVEQARSEVFRACRREYSVEYRIIRPGGEMRWVETRCSITYDSERRPHRVVGVSIDITERKRVEEQQGKLVAELDHRVKNVLATVQAVAAHTMQASSSMEQFSAALDGRIRSMGSTHELLSHRRWLGIPLAELVERELAPYTTGSNTEVGGPEVMLSAEASQTIGMVLHELVTNAAKHGALSVPSGRVSIKWRLPLNGGASNRLILTWQETGGPLIVPPSASSYGMHLVRELIPYELGGTVDHVLAPEGARCQIEIPLAQLSGGSAQNKGHTSAYSILPTSPAIRGTRDVPDARRRHARA